VSHGRAALHARQLRNRRAAVSAGRSARDFAMVAGAHAAERARSAWRMDRGRLPGMRFSVVHSTSYRYSGPVYLEPPTIRPSPRGYGSQRLLAFPLDITPAPAGRSHSLDQDGNVITHVWFDGLTEELVVSSSFQVETLRENPFDFLLLSGD